MWGNKTIISVFALCLVFFSCDFFEDKEDGEKSTYKAKIAWDSKLYSNDYASHTVYGDSVYFYERPPGYTSVNIYSLTKLDAKTGRLAWRGAVFSNIIFCQPMVIGGYVYVLLRPNGVVCFDRETGKHTATAELAVENQDGTMVNGGIAYNGYLYFNLLSRIGFYFARLDAGRITQNGDPEALQAPAPEVVWEPENKCGLTAQPVVYNNTVFTGTYSKEKEPVTVAGFDIDSGREVFRASFGGPEDMDGNIPFPEEGMGWYFNCILINEGVLYYLDWSVGAWDLGTGEKLYRHVFTRDVPEKETYYATNSRQAVYYLGKIYYTAGSSYTPDSYRNIYCIDAATGELVWSDIAKNSESLQTNPIIAHGKLYVSQFSGLRVYEPETGELIGVDRTFCGAGMGRNVLYNDYMICVRMNRDTGDGKLVAVYVGE